MAAWIGTSNIWRGISLRSLLHQLAAGGLRSVAMDDQRQRVDRLAGDEHVELDEVARAVADLLVVHRRVALACGS